MIGDYINDINSYHLHMFDKHDVTTKKFDAIVEKAGKVDANYAAPSNRELFHAGRRPFSFLQ